MARVNRIVAHVKFFSNSCTLSRTEKFIWPSYAIFMAKEMGLPMGNSAAPTFSRTSRHVVSDEELAAIPCGAFPAKLAGAEQRGARGICWSLLAAAATRREVCTCGAMWSWSTDFIICAREPWSFLCKLCWNYIDRVKWLHLFGIIWGVTLWVHVCKCAVYILLH